MPNMLAIEIVDSPQQAPHYQRDHVDVRSAQITKAIIVKRGMESGRSTVDIQFRDLSGGEYVAMLTGAIVRALAQAVDAAEASP